MNEDMIRMAREAGFYTDEYGSVTCDYGIYTEELERFAALVAAAEREKYPIGLTHEQYKAVIEAAIRDEREECAKICDARIAAEYATGKVDHNEMSWTQACAIAIRARGEL